MTHALWVISDIEFDGDTLSHISPKVRSSSGKRNQLLKIILNIPLSSFLPSKVENTYVTAFRNVTYVFYILHGNFVSEFKNVICFVARHVEIPKIEFKEVMSLPIPSFAPLHSQKERYWLGFLYTLYWHIFL